MLPCCCYMIYLDCCRCRCSCREKAEHCDQSRHYYDSSQCRCKCNNANNERAQCLAARKDWDDRTCSCTCPQSTWRQCSTGYTFDYVTTCSCVSTYLMASSGSLTGKCEWRGIYIAYYVLCHLTL